MAELNFGTPSGERHCIHVTATVDEVKQAPNIELSGEHLSPDDESILYHHYRLNYESSSRERGRRLIRH
ncbi:MAG TPA: hypothetical protein VFA97_05980 [Gaiellaceae bacterium]|nr:hypothetical protein [Gaiellaceae bacterium]